MPEKIFQMTPFDLKKALAGDPVVTRESHTAGIPSITPHCMGALVKDKEYAATQKSNAQLIACAPEMAKMLLDLLEMLPDGAGDCIETLLKKAGVL